MKGHFRYSIAAGFFPAVFFVLIISWLFHSSRRDFLAASGLLARNQLVAEGLNRLQINIIESEAASRGFLILRDNRSLGSYQSSLRDFPPALLRLRGLLAGDAVQATRLGVIERLWQRQSAELAPALDARRQLSLDEARALLGRLSGLHTADSLRAIVDEIRSDQDRLFTERTQQLERQRKIMALPFWLFVSLDIALILITWYFIADSLRRREKSESLRVENARTIERSVILERSNRELEQFAYVASHDLQEPLRKIQAFGDRLQSRFGELLPEDGRDYLQRIVHAARRMQSLIDGILTLSRVSSQQRPLESMALRPLVLEVLSDLELSIERAAAKVEVGDLPSLQCDPLLMRQLFQNLLANALKFRRPGVPPHVRVYSEAPPDGESCRIVIQDNGIGFEEKNTQKIFQAFQRLHGAGEYEGTGIGLAVCKKIIDRHNGEIEARGALGEGARFILTLPIASPRESKESKSA